MELVDFTEEFRASKFKVFSGAVAAGGVVKALNAKGMAGATQGQIETMTEYAKSFGAKGLAYIKVEERRMEIAHREIFQRGGEGRARGEIENRGRRLDFVRRRPMAERLRNPRQDSSVLRRRFERAGEADDSRRTGLIFSGSSDFPLLGFDKEQNRWYSSHHPFTAPVAEDIPLLKTDPKKVRGQHYDVVVNGVELGGGSIRIHQPDVQKTVFEEVLQIPPDETKLRFGYMLEAFRYGAPPHGGIALGFDRLIAILCGTPSIRDVIAFPKTAKGTDLMTDSPAAVSPRQLRDLHIEVKAAEKGIAAPGCFGDADSSVGAGTKGAS